MPANNPPETSRAAHDSLDADAEQATVEAIAQSLLAEPTSAALLADRLGVPYHSIERRCSDLKRKGILRFGAKVTNPSGRQAFSLVVTEAGALWVEAGVEPPRPVAVRDLELAVLRAARGVVAGLPGCHAAITEAVARLDAASTRPTRVQEGAWTFGTERTRWLAGQGFHVGADDVPVLVSSMPSTRIVAAIGKLADSGAPKDAVEVAVLRSELLRRQEKQ